MPLYKIIDGGTHCQTENGRDVIYAKVGSPIVSAKNIIDLRDEEVASPRWAGKVVPVSDNDDEISIPTRSQLLPADLDIDNMNIPAVEAWISTCEDGQVLAGIHGYEIEHRNRKGVISAIEERLEVLGLELTS